MFALTPLTSKLTKLTPTITTSLAEVTVFEHCIFDRYGPFFETVITNLDSKRMLAVRMSFTCGGRPLTTTCRLVPIESLRRNEP